MDSPPNRTLGFGACATAGTLWGTGFLFGKIALRELSVGHMVLYRFLFALIPSLPLALRSRTHWTRRDWTVLAIAAFFGVPLQFLLQFKGLSLTSLSHASLMIGMMPVILAGGAAVFLGERLGLAGWLALAVSTSGACLIALSSMNSGQASLAGDALVAVSMLIALAWILGNRSLLCRHGALLVSARSVTVGTLMLALWVILQYGVPPVRHVSTAAWASLAASGLLCTAATTLLWNWGLTQVPASQAGVFLKFGASHRLCPGRNPAWRPPGTGRMAGRVHDRGFGTLPHDAWRSKGTHGSLGSRGMTLQDRPHMIAIDMDGTLVHPGGFVSTINQEALRRAQEAGARIVIATGRRHSYAMKVLRGIAFGAEDILLSSNGTVARTFDGQLLFRHAMPLETARWLCSHLGRYRDSFVLTFDLLGDDGEDVPGALVLEQQDALHGSIRNWMEANAKFIRRVQPIENALSEVNLPIQAMLCGTLDRMRGAEAMLAAAHKERLSLTRTEYPARDLCILDILPAGCSKGHGLVELLRLNNTGADRLMCIGDNWNDLPMLELARWPVLMGNAPPALQGLARERGWPVMRTHDQNAVADALDSHFAVSYAERQR